MSYASRPGQLPLCLALLLAALASAASAVDMSQYPVQQEGWLYPQGGKIAGFGMLARYAAPWSGRVWVKRTTATPAAGEPYTAICTARLFDPAGNTVDVHEFTTQPDIPTEVELTVPASLAVAGVWRVSITGGRWGDRVTIGLPATATWGVRGEMALGVAATTLKKGWLWVPGTVTAILAQKIRPTTGQTQITLRASATGPVLPATASGGLWTYAAPPKNTALYVDLSAVDGDVVAFDGVPGLICPTQAAAQSLRGGTVDAAGWTLAGPLQARARTWMYNASLPSVALTFPSSVPADLARPRREVQFYGEYAPLSGLAAALARQQLDRTNHNFGAFIPNPNPNDQNQAKQLKDWRTFQYNAVISHSDASGLATICARQGELNPGYGHVGLRQRAVLAAFRHLVALSGDDLIREGSLPAYPMTHAFFVYDGALAQPYYLLKDQLGAEESAIWREGLIAVGDRLAQHQGSQSNQWAHIILGHLHTYLATGEPRFRRYFESLMTSFIDNTHGDHDKFGQHSAGYFLEQYGPDGNYDSLSAMCVGIAWNRYRTLSNADPVLVEKLRACLERNLAFRSFHWLPQPDGSQISATAMNTRTKAALASPGYPSCELVAGELPLALRQQRARVEPTSGSGAAATFPHLIHSPRWAETMLRDFLPDGDHRIKDADAVGAIWTSAVLDAFATDVQVEPLPKLPWEESHRVFELAGQVAWKRGGLYGVTFYDVVGAAAGTALRGVGGAPSALWSPGLGMSLASMRPGPEDTATVKQNGVIANPADLTHACVFSSSGPFQWSGTERGTLSWPTPTDKQHFRIVSTLSTANGGGSLQWDYKLRSGGLTLIVTHSGSMNAPTLSLPFLMQAAYANLAITTGSRSARFSVGSTDAALAHAMTISWSEAPTASVSGTLAALPYNVNCLRIPFPSSGARTLTVDFDLQAPGVVIPPTPPQPRVVVDGLRHLLVSGVAERGAEVQVWIDGAPTATTIADIDDGTWQVPIAGVALGERSLTVSASNGVGASAQSSSLLVEVRNRAPTVATLARATPNTVTGTETNVSVLGADDGGEAALKYAWSTIAAPAGGQATFTPNDDTNLVKNAIAKFPGPGAYILRATIRDAQGATASSDVAVQVVRTPKTMTLSRTNVGVAPGGTAPSASESFVATIRDQFGQVMTGQVVNWAITSGGGTIQSTSTGVQLIAGQSPGSYTLTATCGGAAAMASIRVNAAPTVATPAKATPSPVTGTSTTLSVLGADDVGEGALRYRWTTVGTVPAAVVYIGSNNTNAAKTLEATFTRAGTYPFQATITDTEGASVISNVTVVVQQTLTTVAVTPATTSVVAGGIRQLSATARDQFVQPMTTTPTFAWSVSGSGTITSGGIFTAGASTGSCTVTAASGGKQGICTVTVTPGGGSGLTGQYWTDHDKTFTGAPTLVRTDPTVDFAWGTNSPSTVISLNRFTARWTGRVQALAGGTYTFSTISDDGVRLWVDDRLLIDQWVDQGGVEWTATIDLVAGQAYDVRLEYYESLAGATMRLQWIPPSGTKQVIPQAQLFPLFDTASNGRGLITAQGEKLPGEGKAMAFDNRTDTKWFDASGPAASRASWIQYQYAVDEQYLVTSYTITSANDVPERDPHTWELHGSNDGWATWTRLDVRSAEQFTARFQKRSFAVTSPGVYKAYRLRIDTVRGPASANGVQVSEIELIGLPANPAAAAVQPPVASG